MEMTQTSRKRIATRLKEARQLKYSSACSFAKAIGIAQRTYASHESGKIQIKEDTAQLYAKELDIDIAWLLAGTSSGSVINPQLDSTTNPYIFALNDSAHNRSSLVQTIHGADSINLLLKAGLKEGLHVADIGCGNGHMTRWIANIVGYTATVTGIDNSDEQIALAKQQALDVGIDNITFMNNDIFQVAEDSSEQYDLVYSRYFLHHLTDPDAGIKAMLRLLKPGGILVCETPEHSASFHYPVSPAFEQYLDLFINYAKSNALDFDLGYKMYNKLMQYGLTRLYINVTQPIATTPMQKRMMEYITMECRQGYIETGLSTPVKIDRLLTELKSLTHSQSAILGYARTFQIFGIKPHVTR